MFACVGAMSPGVSIKTDSIETASLQNKTQGLGLLHTLGGVQLRRAFRGSVQKLC